MTSITSYPKSIGERIAWARKRKGISQVALAEAIGTSQRHISRMESNKHAPRKPMREKLGGVLEQKPEFFSDSDEDEEGDPLPNLDEMLRSYIRRVMHEETLQHDPALVGFPAVTSHARRSTGDLVRGPAK